MISLAGVTMVLIVIAALRSLESAPDREIVAGVLAGNTDDFEELVVRYQRQVFRIAFRVTRDRDDATDVAQEAFVRAFLALKQYDAERPFGAWISRITLNAAFTFCSGRKNQGDDRMRDTPYEVKAADGFSAVARIEIETAVRAAVAGLPEGIRETFELRAYADLSYDEIAHELGVPRGTVMSRLARARERLREVLKQQGFGSESEAV
ncbi:MAG: ECF RNA polymerase sigma factor SigW [Candidatus Latescibacteria bacterium ADurb.Bin168]|nr:MAG: ECF RNA polymerase sigma factor SigW [Candidatus Latescibacteria bacterium ADurb.Bin168]